jgi:membrane-associated phospholipid phosphatase
VLLRLAVLAGIWAGLVGLLIAAGEFVTHSAAATRFDGHVTRTVVNSRTAALNSVMKSVTWLGSWAALLVAAVVIVGLVITRVVRILSWLIAGLAIAVTGFSRVELGVHWTTDVIASVLFMAGWLSAIAIVLGGRLRRPEPSLDRRLGGVEVVDDQR